MSATLDSDLIVAHARDDKHALVRLYRNAAAQTDNEEACGFFLTHAYVFALELGLEEAEALRRELKRLGRD